MHDILQRLDGYGQTVNLIYNEYDFGTRQYYSAVPGFTRIDPLCEKYYWLSPYLYCANNPVNAMDPDGKVIDIRNAFHSHPSGIEYPSGLDWNPKKPGDVQLAGWVDRINRNTQAIYKIYNPREKTYIEYNSQSTNFDFP